MKIPPSFVIARIKLFGNYHSINDDESSFNPPEWQTKTNFIFVDMINGYSRNMDKMTCETCKKESLDWESLTT